MLGHFESGMQALVFSSLTVPYAHRQSLVISELHGWNLFVSSILKRESCDDWIIQLFQDLQSEGKVRNPSLGCCNLPRTIFHTRSFLRSFRTLYLCPPPRSVPWYLYIEKNLHLGFIGKIFIDKFRFAEKSEYSRTRIVTINMHTMYRDMATSFSSKAVFSSTLQPLLTSNLSNTLDFYTQLSVLHRVYFLVSNREDSMHDTRTINIRIWKYSTHAIVIYVMSYLLIPCIQINAEFIAFLF